MPLPRPHCEFCHSGAAFVQRVERYRIGHRNRLSSAASGQDGQLRSGCWAEKRQCFLRQRSQGDTKRLYGWSQAATGTWTDVQEQQKVQEGAWSELEGGSKEELRGKARMTMRITTLTATTMLHWMGAAV